MSEKEPSLPPGFRFHPTDEELITYYLKNRANCRPCPVPIIAEVDIYKFNPWDLPDKAVFGDKEWYFFTPRDRKYPNGIRPNRAAASGYWKATGTDKPITSSSSGRRINVGVKKALVFYRGKPPKGSKTNWIMHEYRLVNGLSGCSRTFNNNGLFLRQLKGRDSDSSSSSSMRLDDWVLCRIYEKNNNQSKTDREDKEETTTNVIDDHLFHIPNSSNTTDQYHNSIINQRLPKISSLTDIFQDSNSDLCRLIYGNPQKVVTSNLVQDSNNILNQTCNLGSSNGGINVSADPRIGYHHPLSECGDSTVNGGLEGVQINQATKCIINGNISSRSFSNNQFNTSNHPFLDQNNLLWNNSHYLG